MIFGNALTYSLHSRPRNAVVTTVLQTRPAGARVPATSSDHINSPRGSRVLSSSPTVINTYGYQGMKQHSIQQRAYAQARYSRLVATCNLDQRKLDRRHHACRALLVRQVRSTCFGADARAQQYLPARVAISSSHQAVLYPCLHALTAYRASPASARCCVHCMSECKPLCTKHAHECK